MDWDKELIKAAEVGDLSRIKEALANGANVHVIDNLSLRWTSGNGHLKIVQCLAEQGANIHACDDHAIRWASRTGYLKVVNYLLSLEDISYWLTSNDKDIRKIAKEHYELE